MATSLRQGGGGGEEEGEQTEEAISEGSVLLLSSGALSSCRPSPQPSITDPLLGEREERDGGRKRGREEGREEREGEERKGKRGAWGTVLGLSPGWPDRPLHKWSLNRY